MKILRPKTAAQSQAETTHMARRLFVAPAPRRIVAPLVAFSAMEGFLLQFPRLDPTAVGLAAIAIGAPAFLSAGLTVPVAEALGGRMYLRRSTLLSFLGLIALGAFLLVAAAVATLYAVGTGEAFGFPLSRGAILGYGAILWVRQVVMVSTSDSRHMRSLASAALHPALGLTGLALVIPLDAVEVTLALLVFTIFLASAVAYATIAKRPMLRSFGFDGLRLLRYTLDHYTEAETSGVAELEAFFDSMSVPARVRVGGVAFRSAGKLRRLLLVPSVHPGPMGFVSGSDLPTKVARDLEDLTAEVLVAHGPTTHDENPATSEEVRKIAASVRARLEGVEYRGQAGRSVRTTGGRATALAQAFGRSVLVVASFAPSPTDDIDRATGHAATMEARLSGAEDAILVDAHNCLEPGVGLTHFGSQESHEIIQAAKAAAAAALAVPSGPLRTGYARRTGFGRPDEGIGTRGVEALVVEVAGQRTAYVLFDGNNMVPGLRDEIRTRLGRLVEECEILTTDNHSVNLTMTGFNAVGAALDRGTIVEQAEAAVQEALSRLENCEAALFTTEIPEFRVFGPQSASRLTTAINSTMAILRPAVLVSLFGATAAGALVLVVG